MNQSVDLFESINKIKSTRSVKDIILILSEFMNNYGFESFLITGLPHSDGDFKSSVLLNGWSDEWFDLYIKECFYKYDPVAAYTRRSVQPFRWRDVVYDRGDHGAHKVMLSASDFRMHDGFCVPIYGAGGQQACVTMSGEFMEFGEKFEASAHLISIYAHYSVKEIVSNSSKIEFETDLSDREKDVLRWASEGKTNWEIGIILGISARTVHWHIQNAARKLHAYNRTSAIVQAIRNGDIALS